MAEQLLTDSEKIAAEAVEAGRIAEEAKTPENKVAVADKPAGEEDAPEHKGKKSGWHRRFEKLESRLEESERRNVELLDRLADKSAEGGKVETAPQGKPQLKDFQTYEDYVEALTDWKTDQKIKAAVATISETQSQAAAASGFDQQVVIAKKAHPDWDEVLENFKESGDVDVHNETKAAIFEDENGAEVYYYLLSNPEIAEALSKKSVRQQVAEIGRISGRISRSEAPAPVKTRTAAPAPITPVGGGAVTTQADPGKMSPKEYRAWREAQDS